MEKVPYTNTGTGYKTIGTTTVPPGETRMVDPRLLPDWRKPGKDRPRKQISDPILALLNKHVPFIASQLPTLSDEDFELIQQAEKNGKTRTTLQAAFDAEHQRRAEAKLKAAGQGIGSENDPEKDCDKGPANDPDKDADEDPEKDAEKAPDNGAGGGE